MENRVHQYKFALYAAQFWGDHTRELAEDSCCQKVLLLLEYRSKRNAIWQLGQYAEQRRRYFSFNIMNPTLLHLLAQERIIENL